MTPGNTSFTRASSFCPVSHDSVAGHPAQHICRLRLKHSFPKLFGCSALHGAWSLSKGEGCGDWQRFISIDGDRGYMG